MTTVKRCGSCKHVDGDPACAHAIEWAGEIKTTSPAFRRRWCTKCKLSECIMVCGPDDDRPYPCGQKDCRYCNPEVMKEEREYWQRTNQSGIFVSKEYLELFRKSQDSRAPEAR